MALVVGRLFWGAGQERRKFCVSACVIVQDGYTALIAAALQPWRGNLAIVKVLVQHGAEINTRNKVITEIMMSFSEAILIPITLCLAHMLARRAALLL